MSRSSGSDLRVETATLRRATGSLALAQYVLRRWSPGSQKTKIETRPARRAAIVATQKTRDQLAREAEVEAYSIWDRTPHQNGFTVAQISLRECADFIKPGPKSETYVYLVRLHRPRTRETYYKIGYCNTDRRGIAEGRTVAHRLAKLNDDYDCCLGHVSTHIVVVMLIRGAGRREELQLHRALRSLRADVRNRHGSKWIELYPVGAEVYDTFQRLGEELEGLWESEDYVLGDDGSESWKGLSLP